MQASRPLNPSHDVKHESTLKSARWCFDSCSPAASAVTRRPVSASTGVAQEHERPPSPALVLQKPCPTPLSRHPEVHSTAPKLSSGPSHTAQIARDCRQGPSCAFSRIDRGQSTEFTDFQNVRMRLVALQMRARMLRRPLRAKMGCVRFLRAGRRD